MFHAFANTEYQASSCGGGGDEANAVYAWNNVLPVLFNLASPAGYRLMWEEKSAQISHQAFT